MNLQVDINADLGEGAGHDSELLALVSSASIACGFHAGDVAAITSSLALAAEFGVAVGAHPSLDDRANFGRTELPVTPHEVFALVVYQVAAFNALASAAGTPAKHLKPHGALYNMAARDRTLADGVVRAIGAVDPGLVLFAPGSSELACAAESQGIRIAREVFADRNYLPNGALVPRSRPDALLHDASEVAPRVLRMLREHKVRAIDGSDVPIQADTICVHGDTPDAVELVRNLRSQLEREGVIIGAPAFSR
jgi:UPF0271 protein